MRSPTLRTFHTCCCLFLLVFPLLHAQSTNRLKYMIYDFDGLDHNQADLSYGDYKNGDLVYHISDNPLAPSDVLGDRVLRLGINWSTLRSGSAVAANELEPGFALWNSAGALQGSIQDRKD